MSLEVVIGNRLRDVSRSVISKIEVSDSFETENFIVVPDRFSLLAEKMIFEELGITATFNIQVVGISKLAKIILEQNDVKADIIPAEECKLVILNILKNNEFNSFKNSGLSLADELFKIISQLKSSAVNCQEFQKSIADREEKFIDIAKVYELYQTELGSKLDPSDLLTKFIELNIAKIPYSFFFVEFDSLTEQVGLILESLIINAKRVVVGAARAYKQKNSYLYDNDILFKVDRICRKNKIVPQKTYIENNLSENQNHMLKNLFGFNSEKIENNKISFMEFCTPEEEIRAISKIICFEVKHNNKRYRDFNILTPNLTGKARLTERILTEYEIPFFIDSGIHANELKPVQFLNLIFDYLSGDNKKEIFVALTKSIYSQIGFDASCEIENYLNKVGSYDLKFLSDTGSFGAEVQNFAQRLLYVEELFKSVDDYVNFVNEIIEKFDMEKITQHLILEFKNKNDIKLEKIYQQIHNKISDVLLKLENAFSFDSEFEEFAEIFKEVLNEKEIFSIPASVDCVYVGDAVKSYFEERDELFILGAAQNSLPIVLKDSSILSDKDIQKLADKISVSPTVNLINKRNKFKLFQDLTLAKEKIAISYSSTALGEKAGPSSLIKELKKIFIRNDREIATVHNFFDDIAKSALEDNWIYLDIQSDRDYQNEIVDLLKNANIKIGQLRLLTSDFECSFLSYRLKKFLRSCPDDATCFDVLEKYFEENKEQINNAIEIFFPNNKISASQIEGFYQCPFKHFFTHGLKIKENEICSFDGRRIGNFFHSISEKFVKRNSEKLGSMTNSEIETELEEILRMIREDERFTYLMSCPENKHMTAKLKNEARMLLRQINYEQKWSEFKAKVIERGFGYPIENTKLKLTGYADRVDTCGEYFRIIDYKSGEINQSLAGVYMGVELQLFIYMIAMQNYLGLKPAGGLYLPVGSDFANNKSLKKLVLSGFVLSDSAIIKKFDKRFNQQYLTSDVIALKLSKKSDDDNLIVSNKKNMFSEKGINAVIKYVELLIKKSIENISAGNINAVPLKVKNQLPCSHCPLFSVCSFKGLEFGGYREICSEMTESDFINIIEKRDI